MENCKEYVLKRIQKDRDSIVYRIPKQGLMKDEGVIDIRGELASKLYELSGSYAFYMNTNKA